MDPCRRGEPNVRWGAMKCLTDIAGIRLAPKDATRAAT
jgi:hypothetical protein